MKPTKEKIKRANRKGNREAFLEGEKYKLLHEKIVKNKKKYSRRKKHKKTDKQTQ